MGTTLLCLIWFGVALLFSASTIMGYYKLERDSSLDKWETLCISPLIGFANVMFAYGLTLLVTLVIIPNLTWATFAIATSTILGLGIPAIAYNYKTISFKVKQLWSDKKLELLED